VKTSKLPKKMQRDWDERARENARFYILNSQPHWTDDEFYRGGQT